MSNNVYDFLKEILDNWDKIPLRVYQDEQWQSLCLNEITDQGYIAMWIRTKLEHFLWVNKLK